jgi:hypothetical protein
MMNLGSIRRQMMRIEARLSDSGAGQQFQIRRGSGMLGLLEAIAAARAARAAREAQGLAKQDVEVGQPMSPFTRLREDILKDQARRAEIGPALYADTEAIYDIEEADK